MKDSAVFINGEMIEEDYVTHNEAANIRTNYGPIVVWHNHYFVMGNNRDNSSDNHHWGTIGSRKSKADPALSISLSKKGFPFIRFERIGKRI
ncbi:hypothetical protein IID10_19220 [candidate division KSB1 bacterium]|nr:hypothetical protein [candidate division KSB1 bacterium]